MQCERERVFIGKTTEKEKDRGAEDTPIAQHEM